MKIIIDYSPHDVGYYKSWCVIRNEEEGKFAHEDVASPYDAGVEAYTATKFYPADNAVLTLYPAKSSMRKNEANCNYYNREYIIILSNIYETESYNSYQRYDWEEASKIIVLLKDMTFKAALRVWKSKKF